jgi:hypothetical protein
VIPRCVRLLALLVFGAAVARAQAALPRRWRTSPAQRAKVDASVVSAMRLPLRTGA